MIAVILTIHVLIVLALIGVVLMQRSDGGALGIGGGGAGGGGFMSGRGAANALTRTTSILAAGFFATSLGLAIMAGTGQDDETLIDELTREDDPAAVGAPSEEDAVLSPEDLLNNLGAESENVEPAPAPAIEGPSVSETEEEPAPAGEETPEAAESEPQ